MNKTELEQILNDLYGGAFCTACRHGEVEIPNAQAVLERAYDQGYLAGHNEVGYGYVKGWHDGVEAEKKVIQSDSLRQPSPLKEVPSIASDSCGPVNKGIEEAFYQGSQAGYFEGRQKGITEIRDSVISLADKMIKSGNRQRQIEGIRSEPTTGAGLVQEVDECIELATKHQDSENKGLWVCDSVEKTKVCIDCPHRIPHKKNRLCYADCNSNSAGSNNICIPYVPEVTPRKQTAADMMAFENMARKLTGWTWKD